MARKTVRRGALTYPALARFLDGYLHQDFRVVHNGTLAAAAAFTREAEPPEVARVARELRMLVAALEDEPTAAWRSAVAAVGGSWRPASAGEVRRLLAALEGDAR
jgi:hypothetical protein